MIKQMIKDINIKYTESFFTESCGLKINDERVLDNKYHSIYLSFFSDKMPIILTLSSNFKYKIFFYDINTKEKHDDVKNLKVISRTENIEEFNKFKLKQSRNTGCNSPYALYFERNNTSYLLTRENIYSTLDYKRIEQVGSTIRGNNTLFLLVEDNNKCKIFQTNKNPQKIFGFDYLKEMLGNPYLYAFISCEMPKSFVTDSNSRIHFKDVVENIDKYFGNLEKNATNEDELRELMTEKKSCINSIISNFKEQNNINLSNKSNLFCEREDKLDNLKVLEKASKIINSSDVRCGIFDTNNRIKEINANLIYNDIFNKTVNDLEEFYASGNFYFENSQCSELKD